MTPERLDYIENQFRRHPTSPHNVELAHEMVAELRGRLEVDSVKVESVGQTSETIPHVVPADVAEAIEADATPPAAPSRRKR